MTWTETDAINQILNRWVIKCIQSTKEPNRYISKGHVYFWECSATRVITERNPTRVTTERNPTREINIDADNPRPRRNRLRLPRVVVPVPATGSIYKMMPDGSFKKTATFKIAITGEIVRAPAFLMNA